MDKEMSEIFRTHPQSQAIYIGLLVKNGQKMLHSTTLFGKDYVWMQDPETTTIYLERLPDDRD